MLKAALDDFALRIAFILVATLLGLCGAGFLLAAIHLSLAEAWSPPVAAFATGAMALLVAAALLVVLRMRGRGGSEKAIPAGRSEAGAAPSDAAAMAGALGTELGAWVAGNPRIAVGGALLTGVLFGASPRARSELSRLIRTAGAGPGRTA